MRWICGAKISSWSSVTPRSRTTEEKIKFGKSAAMADKSSFVSCCRVPNQINWVFDGLSLGWQLSRIARDSPGIEKNVPRPGQVRSGTMKGPGMNFSRAKFAVFGVIFFENPKVKIYLQQRQIWLRSKISTELVKTKLLTQMNFDMNCKSFPKFAKDKGVVALCRSKKE